DKCVSPEVRDARLAAADDAHVLRVEARGPERAHGGLGVARVFEEGVDRAGRGHKRKTPRPSGLPQVDQRPTKIPIEAAIAHRPIATAVMPISTFEVRPLTCGPIKPRSAARRPTITTIGTATMPFITALQTSSRTGSRPMKEMATPSTMAAAMTA